MTTSTIKEEKISGHQPIQRQTQAMHSLEFPLLLEPHNCVVKRNTMKPEQDSKREVWIKASIK